MLMLMQPLFVLSDFIESELKYTKEQILALIVS